MVQIQGRSKGRRGGGGGGGGAWAGVYTVEYRDISPPLRPHQKKNGPYLNERIFVLVNASAHLFLNSRKELVLQQDFKE